MGVQIDGHTRTLALLGNPVEHTLSPVIHNALAKQYGHNMAYLAYRVDSDLEGAVRGAIAMGFAGLNVTVPYKSEVLKYVKEVDSFARRIGAVNTLVPIPGGLKGYNTDLMGLYRAMVSDGVVIEDAHIIMLGAGGAARSVAMLALEKGAKHIYLLNRTLGRAEEIAEEINAYAQREFITPMQLKDYHALAGQKYLCIQATSVGLSPQIDRAVVEESAFYDLIHTGYDLIYNPYETKFMSLVRKHGGQAFNGLKMLLYQGIIAYELWNHVSVPDEVAERLLGQLREAAGL